MGRVRLLPLGPWAAALLAGVAVVLIGIHLVRRSAAPDWSGELSALSEAIRTPPEPRGHAAGPTGNTTRLLVPGGEVEFAGFQAVPAGPEPVDVAFAPEPCAARADGAHQLDSPECGLVGSTGKGLLARDLAEILLPIRIVAGERLRVEFLEGADRRVFHRFELPVAPRAGWQTLRIADPLALYVGPDNRLVTGLRLAKAKGTRGPLVCEAGVARVSDSMALYRRAGHGWTHFEAGGDRRPSLWTSVGGEVRLVWPGGATLLKGSVAARTLRGATRVEYEVLVLEASGARRIVAAGSVRESDGWADIRVDLGTDSGVAGVVLRAPAMPRDAVLLWAGWRAVDASRPPLRVLLTVMDALRADAVSCRTPPGARTPHLHALARDGVCFERAYSQSYWTRPSMTSIMTGRYVGATGVLWSYQRLPESYQTLAEAFAGAGFHTVAHITNSNAGPDAGLGQGWSEIQLVFSSRDLPDAGAFTREHVEPRLARLGDESLFAYVHLMDPHAPYGPYEAPDGWLPPRGQAVEADEKLDRPWTEDPTDAGRIALYQLDVETMDRGWGEFLARTLSRWERAGAPRTIVAVMADHGEFLGEYGEWGHASYDLMPEVTHVPLILRAPGALPAGVVIDAPVENIDVAPTLLELAGIDSRALGGVEGRSLVPLATRGDRSEHGLAVASGGGKLFSVYGERGALIGRRRALVASLDLDGGEARVRRYGAGRKDGPGLYEGYLHRKLEAGFLDAWQAYARAGESARAELWRDAATRPVDLDPVALRQLEELGYLRR